MLFLLLLMFAAPFARLVADASVFFQISPPVQAMAIAFLRRATHVAVFLCAPAAALAQAGYELPKIENPQARALLERTGMTPQKLATLWKFSRPAAPQQWPCEVSQSLLLESVGLLAVIPDEELSEQGRKGKAEISRGVRKSLREHGLSPSKDVYSNVVVLPVRVQCVDGKIHGEVEYLVSYDQASTTETESYMPMTKQMEKSRTTMRSSNEALHRMNFVKGTRSEGEGRLALSRNKVSMQTVFDNAELQRGAASVEARSGAATPQEVFSANFSWPDGNVSLTPMASTEISSGFLTPSVNVGQKLMTSVMVMSEKYSDTFTYMGADYMGSNRTNRATQTTLSVMYMDNFYKKLGQKVPDSGGEKEVVINGKEMLETRTCLIDGKPAKVDPCPVD